MFIGSLVLIPVIVVRIPRDYFARENRQPNEARFRRPAVWITILIARNVLGAILIVAGVVMLITPGQGIVTIVIGLMLLTFPGKYRLQRWLVSRRSVRRSINWMRRRYGREPLIIRDGDETPHEPRSDDTDGSG